MNTLPVIVRRACDGEMAQSLRELRAQLTAKHPAMRAQLLLMDLDGSVDDLSATNESADAYRKTVKPSEDGAAETHEATDAGHGAESAAASAH